MRPQEASNGGSCVAQHLLRAECAGRRLGGRMGQSFGRWGRPINRHLQFNRLSDQVIGSSD
jgi:hypothetical protein